MRLKNRVAIITGAAGGFGEAITRKYLGEGAKVVMGDMNEERLGALGAELGNNVLPVRCDVTSLSDVKGLADKALSHFGDIDIVINNAGTTYRAKPMTEVTREEYDLVFDVNVRSIYHMNLATLPHMQEKKKGVILNIASTGAVRPRPGLAWYNATKGAVLVLSKSMAMELGPFNIRVIPLCPALAPTNLMDKFMGQNTPEVYKRFVDTIPLGRLARPQDVADAATFLASDEASFMTGYEFAIDGGRLI